LKKSYQQVKDLKHIPDAILGMEISLCRSNWKMLSHKQSMVSIAKAAGGLISHQKHHYPDVQKWFKGSVVATQMK
jgi:nicotinamide mononucleotide (NMN) deamidase PncC